MSALLDICGLSALNLLLKTLATCNKILQNFMICRSACFAFKCKQAPSKDEIRCGLPYFLLVVLWFFVWFRYISSLGLVAWTQATKSAFVFINTCLLCGASIVVAFSHYCAKSRCRRPGSSLIITMLLSTFDDRSTTHSLVCSIHSLYLVRCAFCFFMTRLHRGSQSVGFYGATRSRSLSVVREFFWYVCWVTTNTP